MSRSVYFITHADVRIDPAVPVPRWGLSARGRARHEAFCTRALAAGITAVYSSDEQKAIDGAAILARAVSVPQVVVAADRSSGDIAIVAHGDRRHDQPGGNGGNYLTFARDGWTLLHGWRDIAAETP